MINGGNVFVFVVCGTRAHTDALHFSLKALVKYTSNPVWVITDLSRNEEPINHPNIIDAKTPPHFDNHQASIYLKTNIHRLLPEGNNYCYIDTDVVATGNSINEIFNQFIAPVTFCTDVTKLNGFSPFALNCGCLEQFEHDKLLPAKYEAEFTSHILPGLIEIDRQIANIEAYVKSTKANAILQLWHTVKYYFSVKYYQLNSQYKLDKTTGKWYTAEGKLLWYSSAQKDAVAYISARTGFVYSSESNQWFRTDGTSVSQLKCDHLKQYLDATFGLQIKPADWQHWNGGVFLFNKQSHTFLDAWHTNTMKVLADKKSRTRDQGALIATVWQAGLQNHATLPLQYNYIADYDLHKQSYIGNLQFRIKPMEHVITPSFIHVYKHWGDKEWSLWNDIVKHTEQNG